MKIQIENVRMPSGELSYRAQLDYSTEEVSLNIQVYGPTEDEAATQMASEMMRLIHALSGWVET